MHRYKIYVRRTSHGWAAECPAFSLAVDAMDPEPALDAARKEIERAAMKILGGGGMLPADDPFDPESGPGAVWYETSALEDFQAANQAPVRRNVSMPAWMDIRLRRHNVDASRLFQDAAIARLAELDGGRQPGRRISDPSELERACAPGVLDSYFTDRAARMLEAEANTGKGMPT